MADHTDRVRSFQAVLARAASVAALASAIAATEPSVAAIAGAAPEQSSNPRTSVTASASRTTRGAEAPPAVTSRTVREGMTIDFDVSPSDPAPRGDRTVRAGDTVDIGFTIRDVGSGSPVPGLNPAAWLALSRPSPDKPNATCPDLARSAIGQNLFSRPELDLNAYYVLTLNDDATLTVVDPLFGFGGTKLLAIVALESPGEDWALTSDQNTLLVSMPGANRVAVVDTRWWSVTAGIDVGPAPSRVVLQPDEGYAWIAYAADERAGSASGVAVLDVRTLKVVARIATGRGPHQMAFSDDSRFAFVTNGSEGTVSIVDVRRLEKVQEIGVGSRVESIAYSKLARAVYVTDPDRGAITGISSTKHGIITRIDAAAGLGALEFAQEGRFGFAANPRTNTVSIFDTALNRVVNTVDLEKGPDQFAFSSRFAYVRQRDSEIVAMMPLDGVGTENKTVPLLDFPGGQHPLGGGSRASLAPSIVRAADDNAVLVANAQDHAIYYYQEGMAAPMGQFSTYGREPVAVRILDRSLREGPPGRYQSTVRLPPAGQYSAVLLINSPRIVHCFDLTIAPSVKQTSNTDPAPPRLEPLAHESTVTPGTPFKVAVRMTDERTGKPLAGIEDAGILVVAPGVWQTRLSLAAEGNGVYAVAVVPPSPGLYNVFVACPSRQLPYRRVLTFEVVGDSK